MVWNHHTWLWAAEREGLVPSLFADLSSLPFPHTIRDAWLSTGAQLRAVEWSPASLVGSVMGCWRKGSVNYHLAPLAQAWEWGKSAETGIPLVWNWCVISVAHHKVTRCNALNSQDLFLYCFSNEGGYNCPFLGTAEPYMQKYFLCKNI